MLQRSTQSFPKKLFSNAALSMVYEVEESSFHINGTGCQPSAQVRREGLADVDPPRVRSLIVRCDRDIRRLEGEARRERREPRNFAIEDAIAFGVEERPELTDKCHVPELWQAQLLEFGQAGAIESFECLDTLLDLVAGNCRTELIDAVFLDAGSVGPSVQHGRKTVLHVLSIATVQKSVEVIIEILHRRETDLTLLDEIIGDWRVVVCFDRLQ
jgi:hypothetical protein